jgi:hypothetical protein
VGRDACLEVQAPRSSRAQCGPSTMTARANDLAACDLGLDPPEGVSLMHQHRDIGRLVCNVIELQDERVRQPAVGTARGSKEADYEAPRLGASPLTRSASLLEVQFSAFSHVGGSAVLARVLALMKVAHRTAGSTLSAAPRLNRIARRRRDSHGRGLRRCDSPCPHAHRAERHPEVVRDGAQRPPFSAEAPGLELCLGLRGNHANICSRNGRTV